MNEYTLAMKWINDYGDSLPAVIISGEIDLIDIGSVLTLKNSKQYIKINEFWYKLNS